MKTDQQFVCCREDLAKWDLLKPVSESNLPVKTFCVFRYNGSTAALLITDLDEVYAVCAEITDFSLLGMTQSEAPPGIEPLQPFKVEALSGKKLQVFYPGVFVGAALDCNNHLYWWGKTGDELHTVFRPQLVKLKSDESPSFHEASCGHSFMAALTCEGKVYVWGRVICSTFDGEELVTESQVVSLSCGAVHVVMLTSDGSVFTWGSGFDGQRGYSGFSEKDTYTVRKVNLTEPCVSIVCGPISTLMLLLSGQVWACGENSEVLGFLGVESECKKIKTPARVLLPFTTISIFVAWLSPKPYALYTAISSEGELGNFTWGPGSLPTPLKGSKPIDAFYNNCTPRNIGINIELTDFTAMDDTDGNMASSIEVISLQSSHVSHPDVNRSSKHSSATSSHGDLQLASNLKKFSAELFGSSKLSDLTFIFEDSEFPGHRLFLYSRSSFFRASLDLDAPAVSNPIMDCTSYDPVAFKGLLQYLYTGYHAVVQLPQLLKLHNLALDFKEDPLAENTADLIFELLEPENVMTVVADARRIKSSVLLSKCETYITYISAAKPTIMAQLFMNIIPS